jgi:hypothetical protein
MIAAVSEEIKVHGEDFVLPGELEIRKVLHRWYYFLTEAEAAASVPGISL